MMYLDPIIASGRTTLVAPTISTSSTGMFSGVEVFYSGAACFVRALFIVCHLSLPVYFILIV